MSAAPVSRSSALPEITFPSRRSPERDASDQAFTLPPEPADRPRPRLDDDRPRVRLDDDRTTRDEAGRRDQTEQSDGASKTSAADARSSTRADDAGKGRKTADASEASDKTKAETGTDTTEVKDASASATKTSETAAGDKPAGGKTVEERKAALAAALDGAPVIGEGTPDEQAAAGAVMQPVPPTPIAAEFLALAAAALQGGESAKPEATTTQDGETVTSTGTTAQAAAGAVIAAPVPPALPTKVDGQAGAGGEAAAADIKAGLKPQLPAAGAEAKTEIKAGEVKSGEAQQAETKTAETKPGEAQAATKDDPETGKVASATASTETKAASEAKGADTTTASAATSQTTQAASTDATSGAQQPAAPLSPQAILAAGPQSLTTPQAPLTELDAAAQATAHAQAEAAHKLASGETGRPTPLHVVPIEIGAKALAGNKRFDIRLDPAELGRIDVSLEISDKGDVSAKLIVDRVETLHMLQRDARTLERAFEQAGLKPSEGGIDLSLRDPGGQQAGGRQQQGDEAPRGRRAWVEVSDDSALVTDVATLPRNASRLGGVDLSI